MRHYKSTICICKLKKNEEGTALIPDLPFHPYSFIPSKRVDLNDLSNEGLEIMAKVDYRIVDYKGIPNEIAAAEKFVGNMGSDFSKLKTDVRYTSKYAVTKADKLATYSDLGVKEEYTGLDKDEVTKFCVWSEPVVEVKEIDEEVLIDKE